MKRLPYFLILFTLGLWTSAYASDPLRPSRGDRFIPGHDRTTFEGRYGVSDEGLVYWLDQGHPAGYGDSQTWPDLSGNGIDLVQTAPASQPAIVGSRGYSKACRDFDGGDYMPQESTTWIESGVSISAVNGTAFVTFGSGGALVPTMNSNTKIILTDNSGAIPMWGYFGAQGTAETLGSALNTSSFENCGLDGYDTFDGVSATGFHAISDGTGLARGGTADEIAFVKGALYKVTFDLTLTSGSVPSTMLFYSGCAGSDLASVNFYPKEGSNVIYGVATSTDTGIVRFAHVNGVAGEYTVSNFSIKQVTAPGTDGITIVSTRGGSTRNWTNSGATLGYTWNPCPQTVRIEDGRISFTGSFSWAGWVKPDDGRPATSQFFASKNAGSPNVSFSINLRTDGDIWVYLSSDGSTIKRIESTSPVFSDGSQDWHFLAVVYNSTAATVSIYLDGVSIPTIVGAGPIPGSLYDTYYSFEVGASTSISWFEGGIGPNAAFNRALSTNEIYKLYYGDRIYFAEIEWRRFYANLDSTDAPPRWDIPEFNPLLPALDDIRAVTDVMTADSNRWLIDHGYSREAIFP